MKLVAGLALAAGSTAALSWGFVAQHRAAGRIAALSLRRPLRSLWALFSEVRWLAGLTVGIAGWALYIAALVLAPLSLVQAVSAGGIGLLALLTSRADGAKLDLNERTGVLVAVAGLVLLALSLERATAPTSRGHVTSIGLWIGASAALALAAAIVGKRALAAGGGLGVAAGLMYAAGDVATKALVGGGGRMAFLPVMAACHAAGFVALQFGFQEGGVMATAGVSTIVTNSLPIVAGIALFHETIPGGARGVGRMISFGMVVIAAGLLATREHRTRDRAAISVEPAVRHRTAAGAWRTSRPGVREAPASRRSRA